MIKMEIALFLVLAFIAVIYFTTERNRTERHRIFSILLVAMLFNLFFDGLTVYTVNHLATVPIIINDTLHRLFIGTMLLVVYMFYRYIVVLVEEETGKPWRLKIIGVICAIIAGLGVIFLPVHYSTTGNINYSDGIHVLNCYIAIAVFLVLSVCLLITNWKKIEAQKKMVICTSLILELTFSAIQGINHELLISGLGLSLMTLALYLTLENPERLRAEIVEQKMSMLYLKSQVNPHFLYNTLDTIRIQAELNGDKKVSHLLMKLVDFFRLSVKVDRQIVEFDQELELIEAYMELMCYRYPELKCDYNIDPDIGEVLMPNFILQPIVENSLLHGLKSKGYIGEIHISAKVRTDNALEITVADTGTGFAEGIKPKIDHMLRNYEEQTQKLEGNSIGILNVQKRIKYICGVEYGLSYTENASGGVTAHIILPMDLKG